MVSIQHDSLHTFYPVSLQHIHASIRAIRPPCKRQHRDRFEMTQNSKQPALHDQYVFFTGFRQNATFTHVLCVPLSSTDSS